MITEYSIDFVELYSRLKLGRILTQPSYEFMNK